MSKSIDVKLSKELKNKMRYAQDNPDQYAKDNADRIAEIKQTMAEVEQRLRLERAFETRDLDKVEKALNAENKIYPDVVIHLMVHAHKLGIDEIEAQKSDKARDNVNVRHKKSLIVPGIGIYKDTVEKHADAARRARELWATVKQQGKTKKWVYATIAVKFDVTADVMRNWVSANGKIE